MQTLFPISGGSENEIIITTATHADLIREALELDSEIKELAQGLYQQKSLIVMGRGFNFATCLEGALVCALVLFSVTTQPTLQWGWFGLACETSFVCKFMMVSLVAP